MGKVVMAFALAQNSPRGTRRAASFMLPKVILGCCSLTIIPPEVFSACSVVAEVLREEYEDNEVECVRSEEVWCRFQPCLHSRFIHDSLAHSTFLCSFFFFARVSGLAYAK